jgi:hypothetical protein
VDVFTRLVGDRQGRVRSINWPPADGEWDFVLGSDLIGEDFDLDAGDYAEVAQTADFGATEVVTFRGQLRGPRTMLSGYAWEFSVRIDGTARAVRRFGAEQVIDLSAMTVCVKDLAPGDHTLSYRLELVAVP